MIRWIIVLGHDDRLQASGLRFPGTKEAGKRFFTW
jgi:hypothetical protein